MNTTKTRVKINEKNQEQLQAWAREIEGRANERIFNFNDIKNLKEIVYYHLKKHGINKALAKGLNFTFSFFNGKLPNSYKYSFSYTMIAIEIASTGLFINDIRRATGYPGSNYNTIEFKFDEKHIEAIKEFAVNQAKSI